MNVNLWEFLTIFILVFALCMFVAGIFTAYFGSGKSRKIGVGLLVVGLLIGLLWVVLTSETLAGYIGMHSIIPASANFWLQDVIIQSVLVIVSAIVGALAAVGIFLLAIMKS